MAITKGTDYEQTTAFGQSEFKALPKGGYICKIIKIEEKSDKNGNPMIHVAFDVAEGEFKGYFMELWQFRKQNKKDEFKEVKFPFEGQSWIPTQDYEDRSKTSRKFKGFCTALEDSGIQVWNGNNFNMNAINGALVGVVYQNQEQEYNGKRSWRAVPWAFRSVEAIRSDDFFVPEDKALPQEESSDIPEGFQKMQDDDVPF